MRRKGFIEHTVDAVNWTLVHAVVLVLVFLALPIPGALFVTLLFPGHGH